MSLPKFLLAKPERFAMRVATAAALIIGLTAIAMGYNPNASHPFLLIFPIMLVISGVLAGFTCILSLFIILREGRSTLADLTNLALCGFCSLLCLVQVLYLKWPMSLWLIYACTVLALLGVILTLNEQLTRALSLHYPERISLALIIGISNLGLAIWETRFLNFQGIEEPLLRVTRNFYFSMVCHPLLSLLVQSLTHQKNEWNIGIKIRQRLLTSLRRNPDRLMTYASQWFACLLSAAICQWILITASPDSLLQPWLGSRIIWPSITLVWMPALYMQHSRWQKALTIPRKIRSQLMQTGDRAEDFLHKHHMPRASQETWLGLRTDVLMIYHDPHD
ncbi:MAG: hypothetical protein NTX25_06205 [Proteobacteria bacterium]|nr:hypothetical protein [Pseudomonadota bacterium]